MGMQTERSPPGTSIVTVTATDADQTGSTNAEVFYSLMEDIRGDFNFFSVDPDTGVVSNTVSLVLPPPPPPPSHTHHLTPLPGS